MANPTSNFGWQMPTPVDLVTDLPADFEVFGQAVDTSMADLKGGSTGQVLSKNSNTDMDFVWVTSDDANAIQNTIVNAKGDIIGASANDTPAITSVGANNTVLVADSGAATGLKWEGAWTTFTPSVSGITKGNGTEIARYQKIGKTVFFKYRFTLGSTSAITGNINISFPSASVDKCYIVTAVFEDTGSTNYSVIPVQNTTSVDLFTSISSGTFTNGGLANATSPFTWTTNDAINLAGQYEEA